MDNYRIAIGKRIRSFRLSQNLTQAQLAESLDVSTNFISEVENGKKGMSQDTLYRLCREYHLSADYLLFGQQAFDTVSCTLSKFLIDLTEEDISTVIDYLEASMRLKQLEHVKRGDTK